MCSIVFWFRLLPTWNLYLKVSPQIVGMHTSRHRQVVCLSFLLIILRHSSSSQPCEQGPTHGIFLLRTSCSLNKNISFSNTQCESPHLPTAPNIGFPKRPYFLLQFYGIDEGVLPSCGDLNSICIKEPLIHTERINTLILFNLLQESPCQFILNFFSLCSLVHNFKLCFCWIVGNVLNFGFPTR